MKKLIALTFTLGLCAVLNAKATFPGATFPEANALEEKAHAQAQAAQDKASRKVPVVISAKGLEPVHAYGVLLRVNSSLTQADILLDEEASRMVDAIGEGDSEDYIAPVSIYVDLSSFGKGFYSKNNNASKDMYASHEEGKAPLYVYSITVNPKGKFAKAIKGVKPVSEHMAREVLEK